MENKFIDKLIEQGYERAYINNENDLLRNFKKQLEKLNNISLNHAEFKAIVNYLNEGSVFEKAKKLRGKYELLRGNKIVYISFLNQKNWLNNIFQVTNQVTFKKTHTNRYDVDILINGLPLVHIELKRRGVELKKAFNQINRYREHSFHGLFDYVQIFIISNIENTRYYANNKNLSYKFTFTWKDIDNTNINHLSDFTNLFLDRTHIIKMISRYMVLHESDRQLMVLRAYQYYAVESILDKALNTNNNGYIWHTTGSGKTLTSFKVAQILSREANIDKVLFIVDRKDLDYQTMKEFNSFSDNSVDGTESTRSLINQLTFSNSKLIITTMQKLNIAVKKHKNKIKDLKDSKMILIFDECHRSQFGTMHRNITNYFTNIQCFGFTGTPIFAENAKSGTRTTSDVFGDRLHTYSIKDAIRDDNVLGFMVEYIGKYTNKIHLDIEVEDIDTVEIMENNERLEKIVDFIIENHDKKTFNREFTSIFAVNSISVLNKYYEIFKNKENDLKIAAIYTPNYDSDFEDDNHPLDVLESQINDFNEMFGTNHSIENFDSYYVDVSKKSKEKKIDILLVVNIFLTGFDNKFLNTLYLDKNLRYHTLLQAFSRTNRVLNEKKKHGNIISFRNIKENTDEAIRLFSDDDASEYVIIEPYEVYVEKFKNIKNELEKLVPNVQDVDNLVDENDDLIFVQLFRELLRLMNRLNTFTEFDFNDLAITEDKFEGYKSKYLELYKDCADHPEKVSVLDDIDFEISLIRRDNINVAYILELLKNLDPKSPSFVKDKDFIIKIVDDSIELRSKSELINKFIEKTVVPAGGDIDIDLEFEEYMDDEKSEEIKNFAQDENLDYDIINEVIEDYEFTGKMKNNQIKKAIKEKLGLKERRSKITEIKFKIMGLVEKFAW